MGKKNKTIRGNSMNQCVVCGAIIPEGNQICSECGKVVGEDDTQ